MIYLMVLTLTGRTQNLIGVVDYLKVDDPEAFIKLEGECSKIHQERLNRNDIIGWAVYKVMFKTPEDPYNFIIIVWYDSFSKLDDKIPGDICEAAFPGRDASYGKDLLKRHEKLIKRMSSGVFHRQISASRPLDHTGTYFVMDEINVKPGASDEYLKLLEDIYKPVYEEVIHRGRQTSWSLWAKWTGNMKDFQYVSSKGFENLDQANEMMEDTGFFKSVHPDLDIESLNKKIGSISTKVNSEIWKLEYKVIRRVQSPYEK